MMTKNFFSKLTGIVVLLLFFIGCRQENLSEQNQNSTADTGKIISVKTINLSKPNPIADKANKLNITSKTSDTIFVDYNHVEYLDYGDRETYTFKILNSNPTAPLQNIVITEYPNGTSSSKTVTYNLTETEKSELLKGNGINFSQKISSIDNNINSVSGKYMVNGKCYEDQVVYISCGSGQHNSNNVNEWWKCVHPQKPSSVIIAHEVPCGDGGGDGTGSIGVPLPPSNTEPGDLDLTTPTIPAPNNFAFVRFISTLPTNLQNVINNDYNNDFYWGLSNYYYVNNGSQQAKNFITWAAQFKNTNSNVSFEQFSNWFIDGYSDSFRTNLLQLSNNELQEYVNINSNIIYSQLDSQSLLEVQGANYLYAMLYAFDIPSNSSSQNIQNALNSMCCPFPSFIIYPQVWTQNEIKLIASNYIFLRKHTSWNQFTCLWEASKETVHLALDAGGMIPAIGEFCDLANGTLYAIDSDWENAVWSTGAAIPFAGWFSTSGKYAVKFANINNKVVLSMVLGTDGFIKFGDRNKLRTVLQLTDSSIHAHHLIPIEWSNHPIVQKAAFALQGFHMNDIMNGIPLPTTAHLTGHQAYNTKIQNILNQLDQDYPNMSFNDAYNHINALTSQIRSHINNHPNYNLGQISQLIVYP